MSDKWLSIIEYARRFNVSDMTIRRRIKTGKLHAKLKNGKYYIPIDQDMVNTSVLKEDRISLKPEKQSFNEAPYRAPSRTLDYVSQEENHKKAYQEEIKYEPSSHSSSYSSSQYIPDPLKENLYNSKIANVDVHKLINFCENVLKKISESEKIIEDKYFHKFESLKSEISQLKSRIETKDERLNNLKQKIEDLNLLLDIIENNAPK